MTERENRNRVIAIAKEQIGTKENPLNSNCTKYGKWYGFDGYAWCAQFVSWVFNEAGVPLGYIDDKKGYRDCRSSYNFWKAHNQFTREPQAADIVLFDWEGDGKCDHTGIYLQKIDEQYFYSIEGNTYLTNDNDGGEVMIRKRHVNSVAAFVSPPCLKNESPLSPVAFSKGDASSDVLKVQTKLKSLGYELVLDGFFGNETERIMKKFHQDNKLPSDAKILFSDITLMDILLSPKPKVPDSKLTTGSFLKKGNSGINVVLLQKALIKKVAKPKVEADGYYGDITKEAVKVFQRKNGLTVDGVVGPQTLYALGLKI